MKSLLVSLAAAAVLAVPAYALTQHAAPSAASAPTATRPQNVLFGHVKTMTPRGGHFEIKFDPAWWLTGVAAQRAALEDTGSSDVPNDYRVVEEGHRLLTFVVLRSARVTILTGGGAHSSRISAAELAQIVKGKNPRHRRLSQPRGAFWIRIGEKYPNPAVTLDQQYQP